MLGLIDSEVAPEPGAPARRIHFDRLGKLLSAPLGVFDAEYSWSAGFDFGKLVGRLERLMRAGRMPGGLYPQSEAVRLALGNGEFPGLELRYPIFQKGLTPETYCQFGIAFSPAEGRGAQKPGFALLPFINGASTFVFDVCERGQLDFEATTDIRGVGVVLRPPAAAQGLLNVTDAFHASISIREKPGKSQDIVVVGTQGGTRLSVQGLGLKWSADGAREALDLSVEASIDALRLVINGGEGDGFLQKILSGVHVEAQAALAFGMSLNSGFTFRGGGKLALDIGTHLDAGPVHVDSLRLAVEPTSEGIALSSGAVLRFDLGPLKAVVENIGIRTALRFTPGNLGPADLDVSFMPPNGVGLSLDAGGFKGGGFLRFDEPRGEYAGALELDFMGLFSVKAIGIINTKMPDGSPGFSLLIVITAEFTPIQLSFGFTLNGVGGILGLNRTIFVNALAEGIRTNAIKSILFPAGRHREHHAHHQRHQAVLPAAAGSLRRRADGEARLGHAVDHHRGARAAARSPDADVRHRRRAAGGPADGRRRRSCGCR